MGEDLTPVIVLGTGKHSEVVIEVIRAAACYQILGVVSSDPNAPEELFGCKHLGSFEVLQTLNKQSEIQVVNGLGGWTDLQFRVDWYNKIKAWGYQFATIIHPSAVIAEGVSIGEGTMIGSNVTVMTGAKIEKNVIVSSASLVSHHTIIEDHVLISGGVNIGAEVKINKQAIIAFSAVVNSRLEIGEKALVATGAVAVKNVVAETTVMGIPAREVDVKR